MGQLRSTSIARLFVLVLLIHCLRAQRRSKPARPELHVQRFTDRMCETPLAEDRLPLGVCIGHRRTIVECVVDRRAECLDVNEYRQDDCGRSDTALFTEPVSRTTLVCDMCSAVVENNRTSYFTLKGCGEGLKQHLGFDCDSSCETCLQQLLIPEGICVKNPQRNGSMVPQKIRECRRLVRQSHYMTDGCSGSQTVQVLPEDTCIGTGQGSLKYMCSS